MQIKTPIYEGKGHDCSRRKTAIRKGRALARRLKNTR